MSVIVCLDRESLPSDAYVFKHSTRCGISAAAAAAVRASVARMDMDVYWVNVIEQRPLSDWIATHLGVRHESPQLIEIRGAAVRRVLSHGEIRAAALAPGASR